MKYLMVFMIEDKLKLTEEHGSNIGRGLPPLSGSLQSVAIIPCACAVGVPPRVQPSVAAALVLAALVSTADLPIRFQSSSPERIMGKRGKDKAAKQGKGKAASLPWDDLPTSLSKGMSIAHIMRHPVGVLRLHHDQYHLPATGNKAAIAKRLFDTCRAASQAIRAATPKPQF